MGSEMMNQAIEQADALKDRQARFEAYLTDRIRLRVKTAVADENANIAWGRAPNERGWCIYGPDDRSLSDCTVLTRAKAFKLFPALLEAALEAEAMHLRLAGEAVAVFDEWFSSLPAPEVKP